MDPTGREFGLKSGVGLWDRLGILKVRGEAAAVGVATESGFRKAECSPMSWYDCRPLGGDWGGWTITEGGRNGRGLTGGGRCVAGLSGDRDRD